MSKNSKTRYPKTNVKYWERAVYKPVYTHNGERLECGNYSVKIAHRKRRQTFNLGVAEKFRAAYKAKEIHQFLVANDWEETLKKYKPKAAPTPEEEMILTVGEYIAAAQKLQSVKTRTSEDYARAFRFIVGGIIGVHGKTSLSDAQKRSDVEATRLADVTPKKVIEWKNGYLDDHRGDVLELRRARNTVNSVLRKAKSLFSGKKVVKFLTLPQDFVSPFEGVPFERRQSMRYKSKINLRELVGKAVMGCEDENLPPLGPECLKIFLLASMAGLRRNEIDKLQWNSFDWDEGIVKIRRTAEFEGKSDESIDDVALDDEVLDLFREFHDKTDSKYVIESKNSVCSEGTYANYRCHHQFKQLIRWLRDAGVDDQKPIHVLRKEFGSLVCENLGIYAASRALRHGDIHITTQHYVDAGLVKPSLGSLLSQS